MNPAATATSAPTTSNALALNHPSMANPHQLFQPQQPQMAASYQNLHPLMQPCPHPQSQSESVAFSASYTHSSAFPRFQDGDDDDDDDDDDSLSGSGSDESDVEQPGAATRSRAKWRRSGPAASATTTSAGTSAESSAASTAPVLGNNPSFNAFQPMPSATVLGPVHAALNPDSSFIAQANLAATAALHQAATSTSTNTRTKGKKRPRKQAPRPRIDEETKRKMHIQTEKARRAFTNTVYEHLDRELPPVSNSNPAKRPPKLNILQRALEYIRDLKAAHSHLAQELTVLRMTVAQYQHQCHHPSGLQLHHPKHQPPQVLSPVATVFPTNALLGSPMGGAAQMSGPVQLVLPQHHQQQQQQQQNQQHQQQQNTHQQIQQQAPPIFAHTRSPSAASGPGFIHGNHHISVLQNPTPGTTPTIQHSQHPHSNVPTRTNSNNSVSSVGLAGNAHMVTSPTSNSAACSLNLITSPVDHAHASASHQFSALFPSSSFDDVATVACSQSSRANHPGFQVVNAPPPSSAAAASSGTATAAVPTIDTSLLFSSFGLSPAQPNLPAGSGASMTDSNVDLPSTSTMFSQPTSASPMPLSTPLSPTSATGQSEWPEQHDQGQQRQPQMQRRVAHRPPHLNLHTLSAANTMAGQPMSPFCASPFSPASPVHAYSPVAAAGAAVGLMSLATAAQGGQQQQMHVMIQQQQQQQQQQIQAQEAHEHQAGGEGVAAQQQQQQQQQQGGW